MNKNKKVLSIVLVGLMTAVMCVISPISVPIGTVPISFQILALYLVLYVLDWKRSTIAVLLYLILGAVGLPVFAGYVGGIAKLTGPTGGYLVSYIPFAIICGIVFDRFPIEEAETAKDKAVRCVIHFAAMLVGTAVCYTLGTAWFCIQASYSVGAALAICVIPFIPFDIAKGIVAMIVGPQIRKALKKANLR
ncbi:MAG: biotin transporter BioY [Clostridia bacterium]|nr:biotin transporter BioY [Clostridia bacterium]